MKQILIVDAVDEATSRRLFPGMALQTTTAIAVDADTDAILWCKDADLVADDHCRKAGRVRIVSDTRMPVQFANPHAAREHVRSSMIAYNPPKWANGANGYEPPPMPYPEPERAPEPAQKPTTTMASVTPITEARTRQQAKPDSVDSCDLDRYAQISLATEFSRQYPDLRYVAAWGKWLEWDGQKWAEDSTLSVYNRARLVCKGMAAVGKENGAAPSTIRDTLKAGTVGAIERLAKADPVHARGTDHWDADPWLLNTPGGIVDLRDGSLRPGRPEDHQTKITRAAPEGNCPQWCQFLIDATRGNGELIEFLQRMVGYSLTASIKEHALFFFHGPGGAGKGTFLNTLAWLLGDYAGIASTEMLTEQHSPQHLTFQAALKGRRLVIAQEVEEGKRWAEAKLKSLTGGDAITANYMRHDPFTFEPTHKFAISGNHKPIFRNVDEAIRRRLHLIPFTNKPASPDKDLSDKLRAEGAGIMRWAVAGCSKWQAMGLQPPEVVRVATSKYLASQDSMTTWMTECCDTVPGIETPLKGLFDSYKGWCAANGETELGRKRFVEAIETRGHEVIESRKHYYVRNLRIREPAPDGTPSAGNGYMPD